MKEFFKRWFCVWVFAFAIVVTTTTFFSYAEKYGWAALHMVFVIVTTLCMYDSAREYDKIIREQNSSPKDDSVGGA